MTVNCLAYVFDMHYLTVVQVNTKSVSSQHTLFESVTDEADFAADSGRLGQGYEIVFAGVGADEVKMNAHLQLKINAYSWIQLVVGTIVIQIKIKTPNYQSFFGELIKNNSNASSDHLLPSSILIIIHANQPNLISNIKHIIASAAHSSSNAAQPCFCHPSKSRGHQRHRRLAQTDATRFGEIAQKVMASKSEFLGRLFKEPRTPSGGWTMCSGTSTREAHELGGGGERAGDELFNEDSGGIGGASWGEEAGLGQATSISPVRSREGATGAAAAADHLACWKFRSSCLSRRRRSRERRGRTTRR
ncbi:hypothetical protein BJ742DRAFT_874797 [Cladochytrium replicatum]|nr:hypothetical protein BJ742DRAFT_874797 [Cladochytrium replicatum]